MKYFGLSLPRTGTVSLSRAMMYLGFNARHYYGTYDYTGINYLDFANEYPISLDYHTLDGMFPGSRFIYTDRPVEEWLLSFETHWKRTGHLTIGNWDQFNMEAFGTLTFDRELFRKVFLKHREQVFFYFAGRNDFLRLKWPYSDETWDELSRFTGRRKPKMEFPNRNGSFSSTNPWCPREEVRFDI